MPNLKECSELIDATRALGVEPPPMLAQIPDVFAAIVAAKQQYRDPAAYLLSAYADGTLTVDTAAATLSKAAGQVGEAQAAHDATLAIDPAFTRDFTQRVRGSDGDALIEAIRPVFDQALAGLHAAAEVLPPEVSAATVLEIDDPAAAEMWRAQPGYVAVLDQVLNTIVTPLVRVFAATAEVAFEDPREPLMAYIIDPAGKTDLYGAAHAMGASPHSYGRGGRWRSLMAKGFQIRLNTPSEAIGLYRTYTEDKAKADEAHTEELRKQAGPTLRAGSGRVVVLR